MTMILKLCGGYFIVMMVLLCIMAIFYDGAKCKENRITGIVILSVSVLSFIVNKILY